MIKLYTIAEWRTQAEHGGSDRSLAISIIDGETPPLFTSSHEAAQYGNLHHPPATYTGGWGQAVADPGAQVVDLNLHFASHPIIEWILTKLIKFTLKYNTKPITYP